MKTDNFTEEILKENVLELINKSSEFKETFVFEQIQGYIEKKEDGTLIWKEPVRMRMLQIQEAIQLTRQATIKKVFEVIDELTKIGSDGIIRVCYINSNELKQKLKEVFEEEKK